MAQKPPRPPLPVLQRVAQSRDESDSDMGEDEFVDVLKEVSLDAVRQSRPAAPEVPPRPSPPRRRSGFWTDLKEAMDAAQTGTTAPAPPPEMPPLQVKVLRTNVQRFNFGLARLAALFEFFTHLQRWDNPPATFLTLSFYLMFVMMGRLLLGCVLCMLVFLLVQNLRHRGLLPKLVVAAEEEDEKGFREKFKYVARLAQKIQFKIGHFADNLEKLGNLLEWKVPENTMHIVHILAAIFLVVLLVPFNTLCFVGQILFGIKFFFVDAIYLRFPAMKEKYDTTHIFWLGLPNNAECDALAQASDASASSMQSTGSSSSSLTVGGQRLDQESRSSSSSKLGRDGSPKTKRKEAPPEPLVQYLNVAPSEEVIDSWGCLDVSRGSLLHSKKGRLYLTTNHLCFLRGNGDSSSGSITIPLSSLGSIQKARPISMVPRGFALEFHVKGKDDTSEGTTHTFGALISREQVYTLVSQQAHLPLDPNKLD
eukprot:m.4075 g.4075  ORF g.4075 m.4075 type:complete len:480 (-) comp2380_c1_seq1:25-1464(-)